MTQLNPPLPFHPSFESVPDDEGETQRGLTEAMLAIQRKTDDDQGHAFRAVHAKAHGYLKAKFEVLPGLAPELAQGLFAEPATYDAILRFSTTPGDILNDNVSSPRGVALKVLGVPGARLPGSEDETTQNYVLGNSPSFQIGDAEGFLKQLKPLAASTGRAEPIKHAISVLSRTAEAALEMVGAKSATLTTLAGQAATQLLGDSFYSQAALLHGDYFAKVVISPVSSELVALSEEPLDLSGRPDAIRESIQAYFRACPAVWELRVQLATSLESMPIEDASAQWPEDESPYVAVARITADAQETWPDAFREIVEDRLAFNPGPGSPPTGRSAPSCGRAAPPMRRPATIARGRTASTSGSRPRCPRAETGRAVGTAGWARRGGRRAADRLGSGAPAPEKLRPSSPP